MMGKILFRVESAGTPFMAIHGAMNHILWHTYSDEVASHLLTGAPAFL